MDEPLAAEITADDLEIRMRARRQHQLNAGRSAYRHISIVRRYRMDGCGDGGGDLLPRGGASTEPAAGGGTERTAAAASAG